MPIVRPDFGAPSTTFEKPNWTPGRYAAKVIEIKESDKTDRNGYNALVFKFEVIKAPSASPTLVGKRLSRWFPLGGTGAKALWRCLKTLNAEYNGREFDTTAFLNRKLEIEVEVAPDKEGTIWPKITRVYPYFEPNEVASTLKGNVMDVAGLVDDFDA